jgi:hypothetical protein
VVLEGAVAVVEGYGEAESVVGVHDPGRFLGELSLLTGQAEKFGARITVPAEAKGLAQADGHHLIELDDGTSVSARTVVVATGARYRRLDVARLDQFEETSVYYAATQVEARVCRNDPVAVVGGGNSAGQATLFLAQHAARVQLVVREDDLGRNMSRYLVDRIQRLPNVEVLLRPRSGSCSGTPRWRRSWSGTTGPGSGASWMRGPCSCSSACSPTRAGWGTSSPWTSRASSSPAPTPPAPGMAPPGSTVAGRCRSRPAARACSPPATFAAAPSSGWPRPWARAPWPSAWCTSTSSRPESHDGEEAPSMPVTGVDRFERFFRAAAGLDVDKDDLRRYRDFVNRKLYDLLVIGQAAAKANGRDIIEPSDLPITRGPQEGIHEFEQLDEEVELQPILDDLAMLPQLDLAPSVDIEARCGHRRRPHPRSARAFKLLDPKVKNPRSEHWDRVFRLFDLLL